MTKGEEVDPQKEPTDCPHQHCTRLRWLLLHGTSSSAYDASA